jgi:hypothetical protein
VGANIRDFHDGGLGFENVLTAEALTALDFLPRTDFLGAVLQAAHGAVAARSKAVAEERFQIGDEILHGLRAHPLDTG